MTTARWLRIIAVTAGVTVAAVVLALNFTTGEKKIEQRIERLYGVEDPDFLRSMGVLLGPAIVTGNRFEVLLNGDRIFPAMLQAIRGARNSVTFESYIYWSGTTGQKFADALSERARVALVQPVAHEQPDPPQGAGRGWQDGLYRRSRNLRPVERRRPKGDWIYLPWSRPGRQR